jgi:hypothetical protein
VAKPRQQSLAETLGQRVRAVLMAVGAALYALTVIGAALALSFLALLVVAAFRGGEEGAVALAVAWLSRAIPWTVVLGALSALLYSSYRRRTSSAGIFAFFMGNVLAAGAGGLLIGLVLR